MAHCVKGLDKIKADVEMQAIGVPRPHAPLRPGSEAESNDTGSVNTDSTPDFDFDSSELLHVSSGSASDTDTDTDTDYDVDDFGISYDDSTNNKRHITVIIELGSNTYDDTGEARSF